MKQKIVANLAVAFVNAGFIDTDEAMETVKTLLHEKKHSLETDLAEALGELGATNIELHIIVH